MPQNPAFKTGSNVYIIDDHCPLVVLVVHTYAHLRGCLHGGRKILEGGSSKRHMFSLLVYMKKLVLGPSARMFLEKGSDLPT